MLRKSQLVLAAVLVIVASGTVSYAVSASMPQGLLGPGSTRYALLSSVSTELTFSNVFQNIPGMSTTISIPSGKVGDIITIFCADTATSSSTALQVRAWISGIGTSAPGYVNLKEDPVISNQCATWYKIGVPAGSRTITLHWRSSNDGYYANLYQRSMVIIVNIR